MWLIVAIIIFALVIGAMIFAVMSVLKKTDPNRVDTSTVDTITTAQEFLPFEDIRDGMIVLGNHKYRAVVECSSTNYNLKTDREKEMIEISFQRFLNSLTFPITMYVQTRVMDNQRMLMGMQEELEDAIEQYPQLQNYANNYFNEMNNLHTYIGNNKQKKKYIIIPFEDVHELENLDDKEKYEYSMKEIQTRASLIVDGLSSVGVKAKLLNTQDVAELVFSTYHKDNYTHVDNVINGEFLTLLVEGEKNHMQDMTKDANLDWILYEAQMRIQNELMGEDLPDFFIKNFEKAISEIDKLRDMTSGYYKDRLVENPPDEESLFLEKEKNQDFEVSLKQKVVITEQKEEVTDDRF